MPAIASVSGGYDAAARDSAPAHRLLEWMRTHAEPLGRSSMLRCAPAPFRQRDNLAEALEALLEQGLIIETSARPQAFQVVRDRTVNSQPQPENSQPVDSPPPPDPPDPVVGRAAEAWSAPQEGETEVVVLVRGYQPGRDGRADGEKRKPGSILRLPRAEARRLVDIGAAKVFADAV